MDDGGADGVPLSALPLPLLLPLWALLLALAFAGLLLLLWVLLFVGVVKVVSETRFCCFGDFPTVTTSVAVRCGVAPRTGESLTEPDTKLGERCRSVEMAPPVGSGEDDVMTGGVGPGSCITTTAFDGGGELSRIVEGDALDFSDAAAAVAAAAGGGAEVLFFAAAVSWCCPFTTDARARGGSGGGGWKAEACPVLSGFPVPGRCTGPA